MGMHLYRRQVKHSPDSSILCIENIQPFSGMPALSGLPRKQGESTALNGLKWMCIGTINQHISGMPAARSGLPRKRGESTALNGCRLVPQTGRISHLRPLMRVDSPAGLQNPASSSYSGLDSFKSHRFSAQRYGKEKNMEIHDF